MFSDGGVHLLQGDWALVIHMHCATLQGQLSWRKRGWSTETQHMGDLPVPRSFIKRGGVSPERSGSQAMVDQPMAKETFLSKSVSFYS